VQAVLPRWQLSRQGLALLAALPAARGGRRPARSVAEDLHGKEARRLERLPDCPARPEPLGAQPPHRPALQLGDGL